ncbi:MAG: hypothetical protein ACK5TK_01245 [Betaproteobacteria bacterium]
MSKAAVKLVVKGPRRKLKPRNPLAVVARQRAAGAHGPSGKAERQRGRRQLKKLLDEG